MHTTLKRSHNEVIGSLMAKIPAKGVSFATFEDVVDHVAHESYENGKRLTVPVISQRMGCAHAHLSKAVSRYDTAHPLRGNMIVDLTRATANFAIVRWICHMVGGVFVRLPKPCAHASMQPLFEAMTTHVGSFSRQLHTLQQHMADGVVVQSEADEIHALALEVVATALAISQSADAAAGITRDLR